mgnify:CR=1 FL=1
MDQNTVWREINAIRVATLAARKRTGNDQIGTEAVKGGLCVCYWIPRKDGRFDVERLTPGMQFEDVVKYLNAL